MGYSLLLSLALHIGAALVFIVAGGVVTGVGKAPKFIVQEVLLGPSPSSPNQSIAPPSLGSSSDKTPLTPTAEQESVEQVQEQPPDQSSEASVNSKEGDILSIPLGLGMTHGYFSGLADGRTLKDDVRGYYFEMVEKINREWWSQAVQLKEPIRQDGIFDVLLQRDGTIVSIQIKQGTGLPEADRLLLEIIKKSSPLPPLPSTYELGMFRAPLRIKAPSFLFRLGK
ncbi:MAG: TonB C-terminal domain-containing protein [Geobacteraceae bacterium]|nr:TonB C-terminal domain-containing protein [Geobacteraceae bacterium]NTW79661.1 TonB C-terminal domain-containing protein [Geobacteraceae bacterium]